MNRADSGRNAQEIHRWDAAAAIDATGAGAAPASLLVEIRSDAMPRLLALGTPPQVDTHEAARRSIVHRLPGHVIVPGLVNAHTHLDLTHIGPREHDPDRGFVPWIDMVRRERRTDDESIGASVRDGIALNLRGGSVAIGDIAGSPRGNMTLAPWRELHSAGVLGVSYLEFFGIGGVRTKAQAQVEAMIAGDAWRDARRQGTRTGSVPGLQPHAPYSVDRRLYERIAQIAAGESVPLATHLAETLDERQFVRDGSGPNVDFLKALGIWDQSILEEVGRGASPVAHLRGVLSRSRWCLAHVHDASNEDIELLAGSRASVAYCPTAGEYFGAARSFGPHRYRDMLRAGVNVCLGTDSVVNLPATRVAVGGISILDEMRVLHQRDHADALTLLAMGTTNGARALQLDAAWFRWTQGGPIAGAIAIGVEGGHSPMDAWAAALRGKSPPRVLFRGNLSCGVVHADA